MSMLVWCYRRLVPIPIFVAALVFSSCVVPKVRELTAHDELYVMTESDVLGRQAASVQEANVVRTFRTSRSRQHGYYFFLTSRLLHDSTKVIVRVSGTLLKTSGKAAKIHRADALGATEREDLAQIYGVDHVAVRRTESSYLLALLDGNRTYSIEVEGAVVSESVFRDSLIRKLSCFREENLEGYPVSWL
jgi:hypothetical protein